MLCVLGSMTTSFNTNKLEVACRGNLLAAKPRVLAMPLQKPMPSPLFGLLELPDNGQTAPKVNNPTSHPRSISSIFLSSPTPDFNCQPAHSQRHRGHPIARNNCLPPSSYSAIRPTKQHNVFQGARKRKGQGQVQGAPSVAQGKREAGRRICKSIPSP